jgi:hypothetical protein
MDILHTHECVYHIRVPFLLFWVCHSFAFRVGGNSSVAQGAPSEKDSQVLETTTKAQAAFSQAALFFCHSPTVVW